MDNGVNPIQTLYDNATKEAEAEKRRGQKNKLSDRDMRHLSIEVKKRKANGDKTTVDDMMKLVNASKETRHHASRRTARRSPPEARTPHEAQQKVCPKEAKTDDPPTRPRRRRGRCAHTPSPDKPPPVTPDEPSLGPKATCHRYEKQVNVDNI